MCGIAGIMSRSNAAPNVDAMLNAMRHRGPDDRGTWSGDGIFLGHNRLSIIDLSPAGHQPMASHSGRYVIVYNGEIYNFRELRHELIQQGIRFRSESDTEVILALWEREGVACIERLRGMFAFGVWDTAERTLTLVRDRLGIKPLYYAETPQGFVFASEIKGMLASGLVKRDVNERAIALFLQKGYVQQPHTIVRDVKSLMPGCLLLRDTEGMHEKTYWNLSSRGTQYQSEAESIEDIRATIIESAKEEMISDRPVGVFLSGGLDSTILVAALRAAGHQHIRTFTVGFDSTEKNMSESTLASESARFYDTEHYNLQIEKGDIQHVIDAYIGAIDQPSIDGLNVWLVSQKTAEHVTVAISGLGGDELFCGYSIDRTMLYWRKQRYATLNAIHYSAPLWKNIPLPTKVRAGLEARKRFKDFTTGYMSWAEIFAHEEVATLSRQRNGNSVYKTFDRFAQGEFADELQRITAMHLHTFMSGRLLTISDACSMAHSLEVRFPLIDHRLVEKVYNIPQSWRLRRIAEAARLKNFEAENNFEKTGVKHLLYQAFKKDLPYGFGDRAKKGFKLPMQAWLKNELHMNVKDLLMSRTTYLPPSGIKQVWREWNTGRSAWTRIWSLYVLESFLDRYSLS